MRDILSFKEIAPLNLASIFLSYHFYKTKSRKRRHKKSHLRMQVAKVYFSKIVGSLGGMARIARKTKIMLTTILISIPNGTIICRASIIMVKTAARVIL